LGVKSFYFNNYNFKKLDQKTIVSIEDKLFIMITYLTKLVALHPFDHEHSEMSLTNQKHLLKILHLFQNFQNKKCNYQPIFLD
jgi:hypothetical protein